MNLYSQEDIERAKKRGRAYLCTSCYHKSERQVKKIDEKGRIEDHILKTHVTPERWPFFCTLCLFRCTRREQLDHHVTSYQRHMDMASARQIKDSSPWLVESPNPYQISEFDYAKLSQEESLQFYLQRHGSKGVNGNPINAALRKMTEGTLEDDITSEFLKAGSMPDSPVTVGGNKQQELNWAEIIDGPIQTSSWTSGSQNLIASPVVSSQFLTGLSGSPIVNTVRPSTSDHVSQATTIVVQQHPATPQDLPPATAHPVICTASMPPWTPVTSVPTVASTANMPQWMPAMNVQPVARTTGTPQGTLTTSEQLAVGIASISQGAPVTSAPPVSRIADQPQRTSMTPASPAIVTNVPQTQTQAAGTIQPEPWTWVPGTTAKAAPQVSLPSRTTVTETLPVASTTKPMTPKVSQPNQSVEDASPLDLSRFRKGSDRKPTCESPSQADPEVLDLSLQHHATSGDETARDHQPDQEEPQLQGSGVRPSETESDIVEDILPQLLERGTADTAPAEEDEEEEPRPKRPRLESNRGAEPPVFNISMLAVNGLTETLQKVNSRMAIREKTSGRTEKALTEAISEMGKVASALNSLRKAIEESARDAKRREERRVEAERLRDEEQRRWREEDKRREDRRWEQEKFERQELRRLLTERKEETNKDKENKLKSALGRTYTRHSVQDYNSRR